VSALLSLPNLQSAPPARHRFFAYGSGVLSHHPANGASYYHVADNLGGQTWAIAGGAGAFLTPSIGLEGEFVLGGLVSAPQVFSYSYRTEYIAQNRDIVIDGLLRFRSSERSVWQFLAGGGFARTRTNTIDRVVTTSTARRRRSPIRRRRATTASR
jgi:hypothetical protein